MKYVWVHSRRELEEAGDGCEGRQGTCVKASVSGGVRSGGRAGGSLAAASRAVQRKRARHGMDPRAAQVRAKVTCTGTQATIQIRRYCRSAGHRSRDWAVTRAGSRSVLSEQTHMKTASPAAAARRRRWQPRTALTQPPPHALPPLLLPSLMAPLHTRMRGRPLSVGCRPATDGVRGLKEAVQQSQAPDLQSLERT